MKHTTVKSRDELDAAFLEIASADADALHVASDALFDSVRERIVAFAAARRLPTVYEHRAFAEAGGLMLYGPKSGRRPAFAPRGTSIGS